MAFDGGGGAGAFVVCVPTEALGGGVLGGSVGEALSAVLLGVLGGSSARFCRGGNFVGGLGRRRRLSAETSNDKAGMTDS